MENVAAAASLAAENARAANRVYNVAESPNLSEFEWTRRVAAEAGWDGVIIVVPDASAPPHLAAPGTIAWERAHPPSVVDAGQFDYAAEDAALAAPDIDL